jgi:hypothetical protein
MTMTRRALECVCGEHLEGRSDTELLEAYRAHCQSEHPDWSEADLKAQFARNAYDGPR